MLDLQAEDLLLQQALLAGLITEADLANVAAEPAPSVGPQPRWGRRLDILVLRGHLRTDDIERLIAAQQQRSRALDRTVNDSSAGGHAETPAVGAVDATIGADGAPLALAHTMASAAAQPVVTISAPPLSFPVPHWDKYEFQSLLGRGGMGAVYKARDRRLGRTVALKFIHGDDPTLINRFMQEARAQARLHSAHICKVHEVGQVDGKPYIAMEFIDGLPLDKAAAALSLPDKVQVMRDIARAMHIAHEAGVIHRDIKPSNMPPVARPVAVVRDTSWAARTDTA